MRILKVIPAIVILLGSLAGLGKAFACEPNDRGQYDSQLVFDPTAYTTVTVTVDGASITLRQWEVTYVAKPQEMSLTQLQSGPPGTATTTVTITDPYQYEKMYISVPQASFNSKTAPIFLMVGNEGWRYSAVSTSITSGASFTSTSNTDVYGAALNAGYVVVEAANRGRGLIAADGTWTGKSPDAIVDTKAAIRYLRLNDGLIPGSADRIVIHGGSGGGGLDVQIGASGDNDDYCSYLDEVGAAGVIATGHSCRSTIKDDVYAVVAYCPINNLPNHDKGYEWQYNPIRALTGYTGNPATGSLDGIAYTDANSKQPAASAAISAQFGPYLERQHIRLPNGKFLSTDNMTDEIVAQLKAETERQIAAGTTIPALGGDFSIASAGPPGMGGGGTMSIPNEWLDVEDGVVKNINYTNFTLFQATASQLKTVVAFDGCGVTDEAPIDSSCGVESSLFGSKYQTYSNFTEWSWNNNDDSTDGVGYDNTGLKWHEWLKSPLSGDLAKQIKLVNPVEYLTSQTDGVAPYWYIRHGMLDRDGATAMQVLLYYAVKDNRAVKNVNFKVPWMQPHGGDYDVQEAFTWIKSVLAANGR